MTPLLEADELYRFYHAGDDETLALKGVSIAVEAGEVVAIIGPSGSGKSTLLACLAGLDEPDGGVVRVNGVRLSRRPEEERARMRAERIGMLFQSDNLLGHLNVHDNIAAARAVAGKRRASSKARDVLERLGIAERAHDLPSRLSGGELARAGLAVAVANDPEVILADEPTGELDESTSARVLELLRERAGEGAAVLVVTHDPDVAARADRTIRLRDGRVEQ
ncbi:MAG: putative transport system ATP-binding protein [bacterium]